MHESFNFGTPNAPSGVTKAREPRVVVFEIAVKGRRPQGGRAKLVRTLLETINARSLA